MNEQELTELLERTLDDKHLSRGEKKALAQILEEQMPDEATLAVWRHKAFDVARNNLIHGQRQGAGEVPDELPVLARVRGLDEVTPQGIGEGENLFVGLVEDARARLFPGGSGRLPGVQCYSLSDTR